MRALNQHLFDLLSDTVSVTQRLIAAGYVFKFQDGKVYITREDTNLSCHNTDSLLDTMEQLWEEK